MESVEIIKPRVTVVITCYNHAFYLADAIRSVLKQTYQPIEIIVVDDGSTDNTREVAQAFNQVKYIYQSNAGLSAARNKGIAASSGKYLVFLDADDWLYEEAVAINLNHLKRNKHCVFVYGSHDKVDRWGNVLEDGHESQVEKNYYTALLQGNIIGMHAAVMYHRIVFTEFRFDTTLKACEDYDLYLKITRKYPVCSHAHKIAAYRMHDSNMSKDYSMMLENVLIVCHRQREKLSKAELACYSNGIQIWNAYYSKKLFSELWQSIGSANRWPRKNEAIMLAKNMPRKLLDFLVKKCLTDTRELIKRTAPDPMLKLLSELGFYKRYVPAPGKVNLGDFDRVTPFSNDFGFDRGGAIDRFYIENFVERNASSVTGTVLEIGDNEYTLRYGKELSKSHILHVDSSNAKATYVGDITNIPQIPSNYFDCIIFTQTLHLIYDFKSALSTCYRILKPGGSLLLTVPGITQVDRGIWKDYWLWSFTDTAMKKVMRETFNGSQVEVATNGNVQVASAFLYGMGISEIPSNVLKHNDPAYQVIITVKAIKH